MRKRITRLAVAKVLATTGIVVLAGASDIPAEANVTPALNNGTWCGAWLSNQGMTSKPCLTFSAGEVRGCPTACVRVVGGAHPIRRSARGPLRRYPMAAVR